MCVRVRVHVRVRVRVRVHVRVHVRVYKWWIVRHPISPVPEWTELTMPWQVRYRTKRTQSSIFLVRYRTKILDAGMPMPPLVSSMPMPSYGIELVAFLHVVQYACAFMNVYMWKVCRLCTACEWQVCSACAACVRQVSDMYMYKYILACLRCVQGEVHMHVECVQYPCSMCTVFAPDAYN